MTTTCPIVVEEAGYILRCILPAGHDGQHVADTLEPTDGGAR